MSRPQSTAVPPARNLGVVRRLMEEVWGRGNLALRPELLSSDYVGHLPIGDHYGPDGIRIDIQAHRTALPDLQVTVDDLFAAGDKVVRRFTMFGTHRQPLLDALPSEQRVTLHGIAIARLDCGRIAESWVQIDPYPGAFRGIH